MAAEMGQTLQNRRLSEVVRQITSLSGQIPWDKHPAPHLWTQEVYTFIAELAGPPEATHCVSLVHPGGYPRKLSECDAFLHLPAWVFSGHKHFLGLLGGGESIDS